VIKYGDEVAGGDEDVRAKTGGTLERADQVTVVDAWAHMYVADLHDPGTGERRREVRDSQVALDDLLPVRLDEPRVAADAGGGRRASDRAELEEVAAVHVVRLIRLARRNGRGQIGVMTATRTEWRVQVGAEETSAIVDRATTPATSAVFVCAHGAGGHMADRGMQQTADTLRARGMDVVRFNFLYKEKRSGRPDPMPRLEETVAAVVARTRDELQPRRLIIGGRSMGGRAGSMLAAKGFEADGLLLLAYPLHPAGRPEQLRDAHLPAIQMPVLCINGTRDTLCTRELMERVLQRVGANWTMHWIDGADHSFHVLKSSGRTDPQVLEEIGDVGERWVARWSA
jgi:predicted alpha/beta-hydrolase family hydrolase